MGYLNSRKLLMLLVVCFHFNFIFAQLSPRFWNKVTHNTFSKSKILNRKTHPTSYQIFNLDIDALKAALDQKTLNVDAKTVSGIVVDFPMSDGTFQQFKVSASPIMQPELAAKYPMIKTFKAIGVDDKSATMRFSITQNGLHAFSLSGQRSSEFIDPYIADGKTYMVYNRASLGLETQDFECLTQEDINLESLKTDQGSQALVTGDRTLRTFKLALSCNAKYGALFAGQGTTLQKKANILAQMVITINRVNEIYERDLAISLMLINRNDELLYFDLANDPWGTEFNTTTQQVISTTLGDESLYDIGHNFNTTKGGNSGCIGCVCVDAAAPYTGEISKGRGYTGAENPKGDAFDIDYVAHEMGHQFGAWHTMNTCSRSGNGKSEVEPASGSSIMGYSGICGENNVQENSDAHFNYVNIRDIYGAIQYGGLSTCATNISLENTAPIASAGKDYTIPVSTPFVLRGQATDVDGASSLTYNWSQNDPERAPDEGAPQSTWTVGPMYRSLLPTVSPNRYMPSLPNVIAGNLTPKWEVTPAVARTLNFALTVRDNGSGYPIGVGQVNTDLMSVTVVDGTPFRVVSPNTNSSWYVGMTREITWTEGETNVSPINSKYVNIKLSLDGGLTYPIPLALNVDNDGSETIIVPDYESETCRILVEAADNIFYDISDSDFSIAKSSPMFVLEQLDDDAFYTVCNNDTQLEIPFKYTTVSGFNELTTFSVTNLPTGVTASFNPTSAQEDTNVKLILNAFSEDAIGVFDINIIGVSSTLTHSEKATLDIKSTAIKAPELISPENEATELPEDFTLSWKASEYAFMYQVDLSTTINFSSNVTTFTTTETSYQLTNLEHLTDYYWRVRAVNTCAVSGNSTVYTFSTNTCIPCTSYGINNIESLQTSITAVNFNTVNNTSGKTGYSDFTAIETNIVRGRTYPLSVFVNTSGNFLTKTVVWIDWNNDCDFNDAQETYDLGEAFNVTNGITGNSPIDITVPLDAVLSENTIMRVTTKYRVSPESCDTEFDGEVEDYNLIVQPTLGLDTQMLTGLNVWPNPNKGSFIVSLGQSSIHKVELVLYDVRGRQVYFKTYENNNNSQSVNVGQLASGLYVLEVKNGAKKAIRKIVVE
ncbi:T9SS type A sorting domain-containing protein [Formosa sediminum]|uniref:T9SS type A sorting domain-containing protein n=1 Tax=Formosa sediminum TaxID=2594004 RepID=A0A516GPB8_9FLAO|nr:zinc-dependent metalloprotease family protein [Formosa sediminum]QDO93343.1 T9SS type A sorting domain-containing protein [Formosa sediminum]